MLKKIIPLSLLLSSISFAATVPPSQNVLQIGGAQNFPAVVVPYTDRSIFSIVSGCQGYSSSQFSGLAKANNPSPTNSMYQVPGGKTFRAIGLYYQSSNGSNSAHFSFGYATAAFTQGTTSTPTGAVFYNSTGNNNTQAGGVTGQAIGQTNMVWVPLGFDFPASSYPFYTLDIAITCSLQIIGFEY